MQPVFRIGLMDRVNEQEFNKALKLYDSIIDPICQVVPESCGRDKQQELANYMKYYHALVIRGDTKVYEALDDPGRLKLIVRAGTGTDNIDVKKAEERGIAVYNTPGANSIAVAEIVVGAIHLSGRRILDVLNHIYSGKNDKEVKGWYKVAGLEGSHVAIIGAGNIGLEVASRLLMSEMNVTLYDELKTEEKTISDLHDHLKKKGWPDYSHMNRIRVADTLEDAVTGADYVTIHVPLLDSTKDMISSAEIEYMKQGVVLINTSRQGIVDEKALVENIDHLSAYFTDLKINDENLLRMANDHANTKIIRTPHICASTKQAQLNAASMAGEMVVKYLNENQRELVKKL